MSLHRDVKEKRVVIGLRVRPYLSCQSKMDSILRLENRRSVGFLSELAYFSVGFYRFQKGSFSETVPKI